MVAATSLLLVAGVPVALASDPPPACSGDPSVTVRIEFATAGGETGFGFYALPATPPKGILVVAHGYGGTADQVRPYLSNYAQSFGVIAIAPEYRGTVPPAPGQRFGRGFPIVAGAEDTNAMTRLFVDACPTAVPVVALGFSMGVTVTGFAIAGHPQATDGSPLYDHWVFVSGLTDVAQQYRYGAGINPAGAEDMRAETGGTPDEVPSEYARRSPVYRVDDIASAGLRGVIGAHSVFDGLSTSDQGFRLGLGLFLDNVQIEGYGVLTHAPGSPAEEFTLDGSLLQFYVPSYQSPFAGHISYTTTGVALQRLYQVLQGAALHRGLVLVDGMTGLRVPLQQP